MGIDDIIHNEPAYAAEYEAARQKLAHEERLRQRTDNGSLNIAATDGGVAQTERSTGTTLSLGSAEVNFSDTETLILGLLLVNTAMTAGVLFAVLSN